MVAKPDCSLLFEALQDRNLAALAAELRRALAGADQTAIEGWVYENLAPETLLSKEELSLCAIPNISKPALIRGQV